MDNIELIKTMQRMAKSKGVNSYSVFVSTKPESLVKTVEGWSKAHPIKTRQSEFLKLYPATKFDEHGSIDICPSLLVAEHRALEKKGSCIHYGDAISCRECRKNFWNEEVE